MKKTNVLTIKLSDEEYALIKKGLEIKKDKHKKPVGYRMGSFIRECALNSSKRLLK